MNQLMKVKSTRKVKSTLCEKALHYGSRGGCSERRCQCSCHGRLSVLDAQKEANRMNLPDGAYWAMMEELTGKDTSDLVHEMEQE
jgi:hypothetical protein